ncbi:unnamed protein product [Staurois parvus]|uniref:Uncharacterized protein n=1 Tax=Staurois parvus TaxID=386267 RepID=A0ABN9FYC0_9NEOB|nr:unnamed protein product [Staurois parvus]
MLGHRIWEFTVAVLFLLPEWKPIQISQAGSEDLPIGLFLPYSLLFGLEAPSMLDSEGLVLSTSSREEAVEEVQNGARPNVSGEVPGRGLHSPPNLQWCVHTLNTTIQNLQDFSQRLQDSVQDVLRLMEQVNHMSSF